MRPRCNWLTHWLAPVPLVASNGREIEDATDRNESKRNESRWATSSLVDQLEHTRWDEIGCGLSIRGEEGEDSLTSQQNRVAGYSSSGAHTHTRPFTHFCLARCQIVTPERSKHFCLPTLKSGLASHRSIVAVDNDESGSDHLAASVSSRLKPLNKYDG